MKEALNTTLKYSILRELYYTQIATCGELSLALKKSLPLIGKAVSEMVKDKILSSGNFASSTGGRKALQYCITPDYTYVITVAMDQLYTTVSVMDISKNQPIYSKRSSLKLFKNDTVINQLVENIQEVINESKVHISNILGIGIGMPGFINTIKRQNHSYPFTHHEINLCKHLEEKFKLPIFLDNDSSAIALGELKFGVAKGKRDVMVLNISWGVGLGMIIGGKLFRGHTGYAGELSHIPISENDILCECGKKGCLETEATLRTVSQYAIEGLAKGIDTKLVTKSNSTEDVAYAVMEAAKNGDQYCIELLSEMGYKIGKALSILIHIINPEQIVLSGRASEVGRLLVAPIQQALNKYCIPRLMESVELSISTLKYKSYSIGAAALVIDGITDENNFNNNG